MTEQIESEFWAAERARAAAERGRQADPSACGTCRGNVEASGQVEHDECAQRAVLLPAPDAPGYELITGMTEAEVRALPPRFHTPVFLDTCTPTMWVCAVCWGDGWGAQWPCPTAYEHGTKVFTPEHEAETAAKKQAAELAELRRELDRVRANRDYWRGRYRTESRTTWSTEVPPGGEVCADCGEPVESEPCAEHNPAAVAEQLRAEVEQWRATFGRGALPGALAQMEQLRERVAELEAYAYGCDAEGCVIPHSSWCEAAKKTAAENDGCTCGRPWTGHPQPHAMHCWTVNPPRAEVQELRRDLARAQARVAELETERDRLRALPGLDVDKLAQALLLMESGPALPWAHAMDDGDLHEFLGDLVSAAMGRWRSEPEIPDRTVLADIEKACAQWRTPGQGLRSDEPTAEAGEEQ